MGKTHKDKDFRILRKSINSVRCLSDSKPLRRSMGAKGRSDEAVRLFVAYSGSELYHLATRRHSASHRDSARKTKNRCKRSAKRSASFEAKKDIYEQ